MIDIVLIHTQIEGKPDEFSASPPPTPRWDSIISMSTCFLHEY